MNQKEYDEIMKHAPENKITVETLSLTIFDCEDTSTHYNNLSGLLRQDLIDAINDNVDLTIGRDKYYNVRLDEDQSGVNNVVMDCDNNFRLEEE